MNKPDIIHSFYMSSREGKIFFIEIDNKKNVYENGKYIGKLKDHKNIKNELKFIKELEKKQKFEKFKKEIFKKLEKIYNNFFKK